MILFVGCQQFKPEPITVETPILTYTVELVSPIGTVQESHEITCKKDDYYIGYYDSGGALRYSKNSFICAPIGYLIKVTEKSQAEISK